jgi:hypothetical protein
METAMNEPNLKLIIPGVFRTYESKTENGATRLLLYDPQIKEPLRFTWIIQDEDTSSTDDQV